MDAVFRALADPTRRSLLDELFKEDGQTLSALETERTGVTYHRLRAGKRQPFGHRHDKAEEVYVVVAGSGRVKLDDEILELAPLDALRVAPEVTRAFEAGPEGLEIVACGARHDGDGELIQGWWSD